MRTLFLSNINNDDVLMVSFKMAIYFNLNYYVNILPQESQAKNALVWS